jgi:two-component system CheB/CheR fusion protein
LQSVNEELHTVNSELNDRVDEIDRANADLRNVFDSTQIATVFLDPKLIVRSFTPSVTEIFNLISSDRGRPLTDIANHLEPGIDLKRDIATVFERGAPIERPARHVDGTHYLMRILPYRLSNNVLDGVLITFVDVSNIVSAEERQRTMVEELNHRVRNMLMVASAIAKQTLARSPDPKQFAEAFLGRLDAMAGAYGLVSRDRWTGVSMRELILTELGSYQGESSDRVSLAGPDVVLPPAQAVAFGMILHELATNAAKYGGLSVTKGRVAIRWDVAEDALSFDWIEAGGPPVEKPKRKGFGTELIDRQLKDALGAKADFIYGAAGLHVHIVIPMENIGVG